jgi:hypothetical protein
MNMIFGATVVVQQLTVLTIFLAFYQYIIKKKIDIFEVVLFDVSIACVSLLLLHFLAERETFESFHQNIKTTLLVGIMLRVATPILQNLTLAFSDDAIHTLTFICSLIHLVFHNYQQTSSSSLSSSSSSIATASSSLSSASSLAPSLLLSSSSLATSSLPSSSSAASAAASALLSSSSQERDVIYSNISINAVILITVLLASRMPQIEMVFAFVVLATIGFSFVPRVADAIRKKYSVFHVFFIAIIWLFASYLLYNLNKTLFVIYQILFHFLLFICPIWLIKMQAYKKSLKGPWDIG